VVERMAEEPLVRLLMRVALYAAGCGLLVYFWSQAAVPLNRPLWTFLNPSFGMPANIIILLQAHWQGLVGVAVLAAVARVVLENQAIRRSPRTSVVEVLQQQRWSGVQDRGAFWTAVPRHIRIVLMSAIWVFLLSGIIDGWVDLLIAALGVTGIQVLRSGLSGPTLSGWARIVTRTPIALRFAIALWVGYRLVASTIGRFFNGASFRPALIAILLWLVVFAVLFPSAKPMGPNEGGDRP
jgi:hypothetical protein